MSRLRFRSIAILSLAAAATLAHAGKQDLRDDRQSSRDPAKEQAREAQKLKLLARLKADVGSAGAADRSPKSNPLDLPLFKERELR